MVTPTALLPLYPSPFLIYVPLNVNKFTTILLRTTLTAHNLVAIIVSKFPCSPPLLHPPFPLGGDRALHPVPVPVACISLERVVVYLLAFVSFAKAFTCCRHQTGIYIVRYTL